MVEGTRALTGPRTLTAQIEEGYLTYQFSADPNIDDIWKPVGGIGMTTQWNSVKNKAMCYAESYFDLSGYELDDLTLAPISVKVQDPGVYMYTGDADVFCIYDILSMERLTEEQLKEIKSNCKVDRQSAPGQARGPLDRGQVMFGLYRFFAKNANLTGLPQLMLNARTVRFGSGHSTAVQKLWIYRIVVFIGSPSADDKLTIPGATFVLNANISKEDEIPYMMRLKRSYELAE
jgi:hypothetical protein